MIRTIISSSRVRKFTPDPYLAETRAVINYGISNSYEIPSTFYLDNLDNLIRDLKENNIWQKLDLFYWMVGDGDMDFKTINIVNPNIGKGTVTNLFNTARGIRGDGTGNIDTNFNPFSQGDKYTLNDAGRGSFLYHYEFSNTAGSIIDCTTFSVFYNTLKSRVSTDPRINGSILSSSVDLRGEDFLSINRTDANTVVLYQGENEYIDSTNASSNIYDSTQSIFGTDGNCGGNGISCYWLSSSITGEDAATLRQLILDNNSIITNEDTTPPTVIKDEGARTLTASSEYGDNEITVSISFAPWERYTGPINVGTGAVSASYYRFRIKESIGYNQSSLVNGGSFPEAPEDVPPPTNGIVDNNNKTFDFTFATGYENVSDYMFTKNGGESWLQLTNKPINIENTNIEVGFLMIKTIDRNREEFSKEILYNQDPFTYTEVIKDSVAKPTGVTGDNVNRTFSFDVASGLTVSDYEFCYEYNVSRIWRPITSNPQPLNVSWEISSGNIAVRVKENETRWASEPSFVNVAYPEKLYPVEAPTLIVNQNLRTIDFRHRLGMWVRNSTAQAYLRTATKLGSGAFHNTKPPIEIPNTSVNTDEGYYSFRFNHWRSTDGPNNAIALSPAFPVIITTPSAPKLIANDVSNTLSAWHPLGDSEILVSINDSAYSAYTGVINVGNVDRPVGYYKFKTKSATNRNESPVAESPAFTADTIDISEFNYTLDLTLE